MLKIIGPHFGVLAISVSGVPSPGHYHTSEMGVLEPVHVLILGEGDRGPGLSAAPGQGAPVGLRGLGFPFCWGLSLLEDWQACGEEKDQDDIGPC
jgi:hypothetical protein